MSISYNGLWKLLIDKNLKKGDLIERLEISSSTIAKMTKNEAVSLRILEKICRELDCDFGDIVHYVKDDHGIQCRINLQAVLAAGVQKDSRLYFGGI